LNKKKPTKPKTRKMAAKPTKITDVASPGKTAPPATSRPIVVTNRSLIAGDPMITAAELPSNEVPSAPIVSRTAKTIAPVSTDVKPDETPSLLQPMQTEVSLPATPDEPAAAPTSEPEKPATPEPAPATAEPAPEQDTPPSDEPERQADDMSPERDEAADEAAAEIKLSAEEVARQQKLDQLIEERTYVVPINAVQRHRSRVFVAAMCLLALLLALILLDAVLDTGLLKPSFNVPHTHIFINS
jgi:hypothetical protein